MSERNSVPRRRPVWRWMILFGFLTFVLSLVLIKAVSPLGDAIIASHRDQSQPRHKQPTVNTSTKHATPSAEDDDL